MYHTHVQYNFFSNKNNYGWAALLATINSAGVTAAELADARLLNHRESEVVSIIEVVQDHGEGLSEGLSLRGLKSSEDDGLENVSDIDVAGEEFQHFQSVADIDEVAIDVGLGVAIPGHEEAKFASKQDSLHALVVERECREQSFPYLLATEFCANTGFGEDGEGVSAGRPQCLEAAIEQGFENVTVVRIQGHPGVFLLVVHSALFCGDERAASADAGQHPAELESEDVEEEVDMTQRSSSSCMRLVESLVSGEVCFLPDAAVFLKVDAVAFETASGASTSSGRRACGDIVSVTAETSECSTTRGGRAGVEIVSAAVKTARAFACEGHVYIASTVDRTNIVGLVERVVADARADHGRARAWTVRHATTTLLVAWHAAQNKRKASVHQGSRILKVFSILMLETEHRLDIKGEKGFFGNPD